MEKIKLTKIFEIERFPLSYIGKTELDRINTNL
jgi:hypothetical protein